MIEFAKVGNVGNLRRVFEEYPDMNVDFQDQFGKSSLHHACEHEQIDCIQFLLEKEANVHLRDITDKTPFKIIKQLENKKIEALMSRKGLVSSSLLPLFSFFFSSKIHHTR